MFEETNDYIILYIYIIIINIIHIYSPGGVCTQVSRSTASLLCGGADVNNVNNVNNSFTE